MIRTLAAAAGLVALGLTGAALGAAGGSAKQTVTVAIGDRAIQAPAAASPGDVSFVVVNTGKARHRLAISSEAGVAGVSAVVARGARARVTVYLTPDVYTLADPSTSRVHQHRLSVRAPVTHPTTTAPTCTDTTPQCVGFGVEDG